jgi:sigma-E factor negative regulatory protein RseB
MSKLVLGVALAVISLQVMASDEDWHVLRRAAEAGRQQPLSGTYLHQMNGVLETFRIVRANGAAGVLERRVALDGLPREIVRNGESLTCFAPDKKSLVAAKVSAMRLFPALVSDDFADISHSYTLQRQGSDRVAKRDCNWLELKPRDPQRYTERICADQTTAVPLKMMTLTPHHEVVEQYTFTEVEFTSPHDSSQLKPQFRLSSQLRSASVPVSAHQVLPGHAEVSGLPSGFRLVRSLQRSLQPGTNGKPVRHMVFSDGLVMLSLFVEPLPPDPPAARSLNLHGAINMATAIQGDQLLTVVGDMPGPALASLVHSIHLAGRP